MSRLDASITREYRKHFRRKLLLIGGLTAILAGTVVFSLGIGPFPLSIRELCSAICGYEDGAIEHVVRHIRLPRIVAALVGGACLAMAGAAMQNVLKNPLASPFTLGVSQGAAFGAAFAIIILGAGTATAASHNVFLVRSPYLVVASAFAGSLVTVVVLVLLSALREMSPAALILAGVALGSLFSAATMLLQYFASDIELAAAVFWTFGDLGRAQWPEICMMATVAGIASLYFVAKRWWFNAMLWGDDSAKSLGVNVNLLRVVSLLFASLMTSVTIAFLGIIGFVGLVAPHMVRLVVGQDHRFLFPSAALFGALLLLVSDGLARTVMSPVVLPVGILTSFAGAPLFLYLLVKRRNIRQ
jgi:iron complex transport system permease protein